MMKKMIIIFLIVFCVVGCSNNKENSYEENQYEDEQQKEEQNVESYEERETSNYVDIEVIKSIVERDSFGLRVVSTDLIEDCYVDRGFGSDKANVYIKNFSSETIVEFQIFAVAYTKDLSKTLFRDSEGVTWYTVPNVSIKPGEEYELNIECHGESFAGYEVFIRNYKTDLGNYVDSEFGKEWYDVAEYGTGKQPIPTKLFPPEDDYDEIVSCDDRYYLCRKQESGFEKDVTLHGIYDVEKGEWVVDFIDLGKIHSDFWCNGDGVFSTYRSTSSGTQTYFISADYGDVFEIDFPTIGYTQEEVFYNEGKAFVLVDSNNRGDRKKPDSYMYRMSTLGELEEVDVPGYERNQCFWVSANVVSKHDETIYARVFRGIKENEKSYCLYVYFYESDESIVIDIDEYYDNMTLCIGVTDVNSMVSFNGRNIRIEKLDGADGKEYYIEFDKSGQLVTEPTLM